MENKKILGMFALGMVALLGVSLVTAYQGDYSVKGPDYSEDRHAAMQDAFDTLDYDAWVTLMSETGRSPRVLDVVTEDNFGTFVAAHNADTPEEAAELRAEIGLGNGNGPKDGTGFGGGKGMKQGSGMGGQRNRLRSE